MNDITLRLGDCQDCCSETMPENIPVLVKYPCVVGIDSAQVNDFSSAVIVTRMNKKFYVEQHTGYASKAGIEDAQAKGGERQRNT